MLSDGVADSLDDEWLQNLLAGWEGHDPQQLVAAILADSMEKRGGTDDAGCSGALHSRGFGRRAGGLNAAKIFALPV